MELKTVIENIAPSDIGAKNACIARWGAVAKPVGSLGKLEKLTTQIAAVQKTTEIDIAKKCVLVFCADNGVLAQNVAQSTSDVTTAIARSLLKNTASVCVMAKSCGADVFPIDMGMKEKVDGLIDCRISAGTGDISQGPAMTREMAEKAILCGIEQVKHKIDEGYKIIATGEAGIGNTTTSSAVAAVLLGADVKKVTGRGSGLSDDGLLRKQKAVEKAISVNRPDPLDIIDVIAKVGGYDIAGMTGAFLGGAYFGIPIVMDGFISAVAALCAVRLCSHVSDYILPSHISAEPAGVLLINELGLSPVIHGEMRLGEGTGAAALFPLLDMAAAVLKSAATFDDIKVEAYKPWENLS